MTPLAQLNALRQATGQAATRGLSDQQIGSLLACSEDLALAIGDAWTRFSKLSEAWHQRLQADEEAVLVWLQQDYVNFYEADTVNPYVPLAAKGPWVVSAYGAVLHDNGGYGMLGYGHAPQAVLQALARPYVMANVMTPSLSNRRFTQRLQREVGHRRSDGCPYARFLCLNSGSESVTLALRMTDLNAKTMTDPGGRHQGRTIRLLSLQGSFHGRTDRPAQVSNSTQGKCSHLATFRDRDVLDTVPINDVDALRARFAAAERDGVFYEAMLIEPVMGEGSPGRAVSRAFYDVARELSAAMGTLLIVDSIQAGLRTHGVLSLVDYPGFEDCQPPDMETWSKALNAGQFPLSVLAVRQEVASIYRSGVYGNTMTTNPRALEVGCTVLDAVTPSLRENIASRGQEFLEKLSGLAQQFPDLVCGVQGTGLLFALELDPQRAPVVAPKGAGVERRCRERGLGVIHGGENALRFTPHFAVTSEEVDLIVGIVADVLAELT